MIEILKKGTLPKDKVYIIECDYCTTSFKFNREDARYNSDQRDGDFLSILCPLCEGYCTIGV